MAVKKKGSSKTKAVSLVGFIDVLATKESARVSSQGFQYQISEFGKCICTNATVLKSGTDKISLFSDCAFFEIRSGIGNLEKFLYQVRKYLFSRQIFFKCAIREGRLGINEVNLTSNILKEENKKKIANIVQYQNFSEIAVESYVDHERFKGIGIYFPNVLGEKIKGLGLDLVQSAYFESVTQKKCKKYFDLRYSREEIGDVYCIEPKGNRDPDQGDYEKYVDSTGELAYPVLFSKPDYYLSEEAYIDKILKSMFIAKQKDKKYSSYYFSMVLSIIFSSNYKKLYCGKGHSYGGVPIIFKKMIVDGVVWANRKDILNVEVLYFALIVSVLKERIAPVLEEHESTEIDEESKVLIDRCDECGVYENVGDLVEDTILLREKMIKFITSRPQLSQALTKASSTGLIHKKDIDYLAEAISVESMGGYKTDKVIRRGH